MGFLSQEYAPRPAELDYMPAKLHNVPPELVRDILTEASEQIGYMQNTFRYSLAPGGGDLLSDSGTPIGPLLEHSIIAASHEAARDSRWQTEVTRRVIERDQHEVTVAFARDHGPVTITSLSLDGRSAREGDFGEAPIRAVLAMLDPWKSQQVMETHTGELDPTMVLSRCFEYRGALWFVSLPPACVRKTGTGIGGGYNPERLQTMVRIVAPQGVSAHELAAEARQIYDAQLTRQFAGEWHGGQRPGSLGEGTILDFIMQQPDIIDAHLRRVDAFRKAGILKWSTDEAYRNLHHDFVAAIHRRLGGEHIESLEGAGEAARQLGLNFEEGGVCPSARSGQRDAAQELTALGLLRPAEKIRCVCGSHNVHVSNVLDPTCSNKVCNDCGSSYFYGIFTRRFQQPRNARP